METTAHIQTCDWSVVNSNATLLLARTPRQMEGTTNTTTKRTVLFLPCIQRSISREHRVQEGKVVFPLGVSVQGDVVVSVYHMRSTIGGRLQAKVIFKRCTLFLSLCEPAPFIGPINKPHLCSEKEKKNKHPNEI